MIFVSAQINTDLCFGKLTTNMFIQDTKTCCIVCLTTDRLLFNRESYILCHCNIQLNTVKTQPF